MCPAVNGRSGLKDQSITKIGTNCLNILFGMETCFGAVVACLGCFLSMSTTTQSFPSASIGVQGA